MARDLGYYMRRVTSWHRGRPRYMATVASLVQPLVDAQEMLESLVAEFDLDVAVGVQLDILGQWIGRSRYVDIPLLNVYFSFGIAGVGWNQGVWFGLYDPTEGLVRLPDETYRTLLKLKVVLNHWDGRVETLAEPLDRVFPGVFVEDHQDMSMTVAIPSTHLDVLMLALLTRGYVPLKPAGVRVTFVETTVSTAPIFGFGVDDQHIGGWGHGAWAEQVGEQ